MTFETITLTFRQKVLLDLAIENEIANLRGDAKDLGLLTKELGDEYEDLLKLITACRSFRVEPPPQHPRSSSTRNRSSSKTISD